MERRKGEREREGYSGVMWYANTDNMKKTENKLLCTCKSGQVCEKNNHRKSNAKEAKGYVYVILK